MLLTLLRFSACVLVIDVTPFKSRTPSTLLKIFACSSVIVELALTFSITSGVNPCEEFWSASWSVSPHPARSRTIKISNRFNVLSNCMGFHAAISNVTSSRPPSTSLTNHNTKCLVRPHHRAAGQGTLIEATFDQLTKSQHDVLGSAAIAMNTYRQMRG